MPQRRVAVTGMAGISPIGRTWQDVAVRLRDGRNGVQPFDEAGVEGLNCKLAAPVTGFAVPEGFPRKMQRFMGRCSLLAVASAEEALAMAGLIGDPVLTDGTTGVSHGSSAGAADSVADFGMLLSSRSVDAIGANTYIRMMPHTTAAAISMYFGITGRLLPSSTACTSGSLSIGLGYEMIRYGMQDVMVVGGSEELSLGSVAAFDTLFATSTCQDAHLTPRPFDVGRDGLIVGEGGAALVLEDYDRARGRGAPIYAEVVGFGTNADGRHPTQPTPETMATCMRLALADARLDAGAIDYVNAHGTATELGDIAETHATEAALGRHKPISSLKSLMGHTLGACGSLEAWMTLSMLAEGWAAATANLVELDERCGELDYIAGSPRELQAGYAMSNNFAFGGVNTSLIFRMIR